MSQSPASQTPELLRRLLRAKDRIDAVPEKDWTIPELAGISCVSPAYFARAFKQAFGIPPHRYLLTRRVERALALLRETTLPITEIAFSTGWASLGTFGRTFRDITGKNPGEFRARQEAEDSDPAKVPACIVKAVTRPDLRKSVSEKRRQEADGIKTAHLKENS